MKTSLSERLNIAMRRKNAKQADLARVTGVSRPSVHDWVNGTTQNLKGDNLVKIASFLDVSIEWLAYGVGKMESYWPFQRVSPSELSRLPPSQIEEVEDIILLKLSKLPQNLTLHKEDN